jgi:acetylornithine deacetylase/succinyl-diaminopimelate desuccinylase-like protein
MEQVTSGPGTAESPAALLQRLIRFDTTNPPGNERECIGYIERLLGDAGLETTIRARSPDRPNLVARLAGRGEAPPLLIYGHVDVVTTEGQRWSHPPFEAKLVDGYVWGRGAVDMKGGVAMMLAALLRLGGNGNVPPGDVIFCALSDEEGFGAYGAGFMVAEHPELFSGVRYALGEFGGFALYISGQRFYPIQVAEKEICTVRVTARGDGGHGAIPVRGGAMARLARALHLLDRHKLPVHVTPVAAQMCDAIGDELPFPGGTLIRQLKRPALADRLLRAMGARTRTLDPLLRNTVSPTMLRASEKLNVIPSEASVLLDGRLLPGLEPADMLGELRSLLGNEIELELVRHDPGPTEPDMGMFETLAGVLRELDPEGTPIPLMLAGVTDARYFSRLGIQTYGFLPMNLPRDFDFWRTVHGADERVPASAIEFGANAVHRALQRLGAGGTAR